MSDLHLRKLIKDLGAAEYGRWYDQQVITARYLRAGLARLMQISLTPGEDPIALPEAEEIVDETILRILSSTEGYTWDGVSPPKFSRFVAICMKTTLSSLRAGERKHFISPERKAKITMHLAVPGSEPSTDAAEKDGKTLASVIVEKTRMRGTSVQYVNRLESYALRNFSTKEIAADLRVKPSSVESYRKRFREILQKRSSEDK